MLAEQYLNKSHVRVSWCIGSARNEALAWASNAILANARSARGDVRVLRVWPTMDSALCIASYAYAQLDSKLWIADYG